MDIPKRVVIMAGLPARGKTFLSLRLKRYLEWQGYRVKIFNAGRYRRKILGLDTSISGFFNPLAEEFVRQREMIAGRCFGDLAAWLKTEGDVAIYDATNVTATRREYLVGRCLDNGLDFIFVENICDNPEILEGIVNIKTSRSVDYRGRDVVEARDDFFRRIEHYKGVYETLTEGSPYIKIFNFGEKVSKNFDPGDRFFSEIADLLGSINLTKKDVYITRHGETFFNLEDRIGGDAALTEKGVDYSRRLADYFGSRDLIIFTSTKKRTIQTAAAFDCRKCQLKQLNEINSGVCEEMSYAEISSRYPDLYKARRADKFNFRYPQGESYRDLIQRVKKAVIKIEACRSDVLVIAHRAVNRCLFSYFIATAPEEIPYIDMPLNNIIRVYNQMARHGFENISI